MKLSYKWLLELVDFQGEPTPSPTEIAEQLTLRGLEVEEVEEPAKKYDGFQIAYVTKKVPHPDADKLNLCTVDLGEGVFNTVICGAPNVDEGQKIVLGTEGAIVPSAGFALSKRKIRGIESNGMICSKAELELGEDDGGIWVLPEDTVTGIKLSDYLGLNDSILDISITPNRADCTGHIGLAREVASIFGGQLIMPEVEIVKSEGDLGHYISINIETPDLCPRYTAKVVEGVKVSDSPDWLKGRLEVIGLRPINNIVDVTNYLLMLTGQPLHAFDLDTIKSKTINIGTSDRESFITLDSKERKTDSGMLFIKDGDEPVALAGVMGGENSEVTNTTSRILIESAYFNPSTVRKTSKKLGIHSDASYRFERGVDYAKTDYVAELAAKMIADLGGGNIVEGTLDVYPNPIEKKKVTLRQEKLNKLLGKSIEKKEIESIFDSLGFEYTNNGDSFSVKSPSWRVDIEIEEDLVEEVGRCHGYNNIENDLSPSVDFSELAPPPSLSKPRLRDTLAEYLTGKGYNQIVNITQAEPEKIANFGIEPVILANPLGQDLSRMRTVLGHSMLKTVAHNTRLGNSSLAFYEIGKKYFAAGGKESFVQGFTEAEALCMALSGSKPSHWSQGKTPNYDFYDLKGIAESIGTEFGISGLKFKSTKKPQYPFSADTMDVNIGKQKIGSLGRIGKQASKDYDIDVEVFLMEIDLAPVYQKAIGKPPYQRVSPFPTMERDLAFLLPEEVESGKLLGLAEQNGGSFLQSCDIFDVFQNEKMGKNKSVALTLEFSSAERTLTEEDIKPAVDKIISSIEKQFKGELRK
ncbi:MAG: phenylalanine--tRNA ligase subunit beta [Candidatus Kapaibacteriales bacterium]